MKFIAKIKDRLDEPSTYAGLGLMALGVDRIFDVNEAVPVAHALDQLSQNLSWQNALMLAFGLFATFKSEKGKKDAR